MFRNSRDFSGPAIPKGFVRALKIIAPEFYPLWHPSGKWHIVKDDPRGPSEIGYVTEYIVQTEDKKFAPLDSRVIEALQELMLEKNRCLDTPEHEQNFLDQIDAEEQEKARKGEQENVAMQSEFVKKARKFLTSKTFT